MVSGKSLLAALAAATAADAFNGTGATSAHSSLVHSTDAHLMLQPIWDSLGPPTAVARLSTAPTPSLSPELSWATPCAATTPLPLPMSIPSFLFPAHCAQSSYSSPSPDLGQSVVAVFSGIYDAGAGTEDAALSPTAFAALAEFPEESFLAPVTWSFNQIRRLLSPD
ncbi:hypothetical protein DFH09DRAFT_1162514, partial [Mycena vulgaris]